eukprot:1805723-Rhodomonas_salina.2
MALFAGESCQTPRTYHPLVLARQQQQHFPSHALSLSIQTHFPHRTSLTLHACLLLIVFFAVFSCKPCACSRTGHRITQRYGLCEYRTSYRVIAYPPSTAAPSSTSTWEHHTLDQYRTLRSARVGRYHRLHHT